jgi:hypothetical protein
MPKPVSTLAIQDRQFHFFYFLLSCMLSRIIDTEKPTGWEALVEGGSETKDQIGEGRSRISALSA